MRVTNLIAGKSNKVVGHLEEIATIAGTLYQGVLMAGSVTGEYFDPMEAAEEARLMWRDAEKERKQVEKAERERLEKATSFTLTERFTKAATGTEETLTVSFDRTAAKCCGVVHGEFNHEHPPYSIDWTDGAFQDNPIQCGSCGSLIFGNWTCNGREY